MEKKKVLGITLLSVLLFLSGCGNSNQKIANEIVEELKEKQYSMANSTYEDGITNLSTEEKQELDEVVSAEIIGLLEGKYKEMQSGDINEAEFYNSLYEIENIGIENEDLISKLDTYNEEGKDEEVEIVETESEETIVETVQVDNEQKQLELEFESYLAEFNLIYNELQTLAAPIVTGLLSDTNVDESAVNALIEKLSESVEFMKTMQKYENIEKYSQTYDAFMEGCAKLIAAYTFMSNGMESGDYELVITGLGDYVESEDYFVETGEIYANESYQ